MNALDRSKAFPGLRVYTMYNTENKQDGVCEVAREFYERPMITTFGSVSNLTLGRFGSRHDFRHGFDRGRGNGGGRF